MAIRMTPITRQIINFVNENGFITTRICEKTIFKGNKQALIQSQAKLKSLYDNKILKRYSNKYNNEYIYYKNSRPTEHKKLITELYSWLNYYTDEIIYFAKEQTFNKRRCDLNIVFKINNEICGLWCEVDVNHPTTQKKLDEIYNDGFVQQWYKDKFGVDYFPAFLVVTATGDKKWAKDRDYMVFNCDYTFSQLPDILFN